MNSIDRSGASIASGTSATSLTGAAKASRLFYADPLRGGIDALPALLDEAAAQGFDAVLIPPPWQPGADGDRFTSASYDKCHPALGADFLQTYVKACRARGLAPMIDVVLDHVAAAFIGNGVAFEPEPAPLGLDPRHYGHSRQRRLVSGADAAPWWAAQVVAWATLGIAGVRLLGLATIDAAPIITAIRAAAPGVILIAWTPGLPAEALSGVRGVDYVVSSLPWWDRKSPWLIDELARLRAIASVLSCPEAPFETRVAASVAETAGIRVALQESAALAAAFGAGWIVPEGFATGARRKLDRRGLANGGSDQHADIGAEIERLNAMMASSFNAIAQQVLTGLGEPILAVLQTDAADARFAAHAQIHLVNMGPVVTALDPAGILSGVDGSFEPFKRADSGAILVPGRSVSVAPGSFQIYSAARRAMVMDSALSPVSVRPFATGPRVSIEAPAPSVAGGFAAKRVVGEVVPVSADLICDGHDKLSAILRSRGPGETAWTETRMVSLGNDRFGADLALIRIGAYEYDIQAWRDVFATYRYELAKKVEAGLDVSLEVREGVILVTNTAKRASTIQAVVKSLAAADQAGQQAILLSPDLAAQMETADDRPRAASLPHPILIDAERSGAAFAAWYEVFPRSMSDDPVRHGNFADVERHLPRVQAMGFDVLYFPPIHPIGRINRKGANNTLTPSKTDPGSPYAIGAAEGGHEALHPELGSFDDFHHLIQAAAGHGLEIAIDFAIQCSPDHPWLKDHRDWFEWRPDGSIRYAENPPKKYQDIVNVDFYAGGAIPDLWVALANSVLFWCRHGIRLFRVDNPHTKPFPFWHWMIAEVRNRFPDAVFLAEAFTRPKIMYRLAKVGFSQSYSYFTWRETKREMEAYLTELSEPGPRDFFRPHFFVNTPDINPVYLQGAPRSAYVIRAALAATLSGLWGVYSGFEICEGTPVPGREEYLDSEKYQIRAWDWDRPGNIVAEITALNRLRRLNPALRTHLDAVFLPAGNTAVSVFEKATTDRTNVVVTAISFDPNQPQETGFEFPFWHWGVTEQAAFDAENLVTGERAVWRGKFQSVRLTPDAPYACWRVAPAS